DSTSESRMPSQNTGRLSNLLQAFAAYTTAWVGSSRAFVIAAILTLLWLVSGPLFHFSDTWQLVMNTVSSVVTFLMVFLLQRSHNPVVQRSRGIDQRQDEMKRQQERADSPQSQVQPRPLRRGAREGDREKIEDRDGQQEQRGAQATPEPARFASIGATQDNAG